MEVGKMNMNGVLQRKNFENPDETQNIPNLKVHTIKMSDQKIIKQVYEPGWKWSKDVKPLVKTESCQMHHVGIFVSGKMRVRLNDGTETEFRAGDVANIPPGHDGWVVGDEPVVYYSFECQTCSDETTQKPM
jgi:mannose-6-phosphate isomerase-like protein (cupin superfamily)